MMKRLIILFLGLYCLTSQAQFFDAKAEVTTFKGFYNFHYSEKEGKLYLEIPNNRLDQEFLYVHALRSGLGSNDIGLDRGQLGGGEVVKWIRSGNKILLIQPNQKYRAVTKNSAERKSIEEAFARSVLFGFEIKQTINNVHLVDLTPFLMEDAHNVVDTLKKQGQGKYKLENSRSVLWMERTKAFPKNVEFEALLTFVGEPSKPEVKSVSPNPYTITTIQHHSFVELPDAGYTPREFDPRCGSYPLSFMDYSTPIDQPITKHLITRHRLEKKNPNAEVSEAKEPIVYYLDPGTPEPVRSALLEGARWWNQAFTAIGYKDGFQVKMLPEDADPLDLRYNVIQWVHRSTRGWSYGASITDPRTGEIIKGHVSLGSLRIRQDFMIAQALLNQPFAESDSNTDPMLQMALARIRQLSAHEVGHTLGFTHNFASSTNGRASVMDYPHPLLQITNGQLNFSQAYDTGIGEWDKVSVAYSYADIPNGVDETTYLKSILEGAFNRGLRFITDSDARAIGGAHGLAHLWDNGANAAVELDHLLTVREWAINNFSENNIRTGEPYSVLEDVFVPLYFLHRYQTEATVKSIGGMDYDYKLKNYAGKTPEYLPVSQQKQALDAVLKTLTAETLAIPKDKLSLFPPRAFGYSRTRESFKSETGVAFDALGATATAAKMTLDLLLHPERLNRLAQQKAVDGQNLGVSEVVSALLETTLNTKAKGSYEEAVSQMIQTETLHALMNASLNPKVRATAKGALLKGIDAFKTRFEKEGSDFAYTLLKEIEQFEDDPKEFKTMEAPKIPDGSPIGSYQCTHFE